MEAIETLGRAANITRPSQSRAGFMAAALNLSINPDMIQRKLIPKPGPHLVGEIR
jgi:hypothetical protein